MSELDALRPAVDVDLGRIALDAGQSTGRLLLVAATVLVAIRFTRRAIHRVDDHRTREQLLFIVPKLTAVVVAIVGLTVMGIDVSGMAAVLATIGFTGAVVFTPVGQNFVAGAMISIDDLYRQGEVVSVGDIHGTVVYRSLLRTELELPDGTKAWVPNSTFQDEEVRNHSRLGGWRICVQVPLDRASDRRLAVDLMEQVLAELPWNSKGKQPFLAFDRVGSEAMFFNAFAWIDDRTLEPHYRGLLLSALVDTLESSGVSVGQTTNLSISSDRGAGARTATPAPRRRRWAHPPDAASRATRR
ncbi:MAG: mechanosensitive ion channel family protein [Acidimicrobiales bacterium]